MQKITIGIIGSGRFGNLLFQTFKNHFENSEILLYSRNENNRLRCNSQTQEFKDKFITLEDVVSCNIVIPAVPISKFEETVKSISKFLKPGSLVVDVCSVSIHPAEVLLTNISKDIDILSTHPMFGPDSTKNGTTFEGLKFIFKELRISNHPDLPKADQAGELSKRFLNFWRKLGCDMVELTPDEHDRQAAFTHAFAFLIGKIGILMNVRKNNISTKGFEGLLYNQLAVENDTSELFNDMMKYNPYVKEMIADFKAAFGKIEKDII